MPTDLRLWACVPTILAWIEQEIYANTPGSSLSDRCGHNTGLLRVLTFGYATQVFASEEIAGECRTNSLFQRLCGGGAPFGHELRTFRRRNRILLERVLRGVLMRAILHKFGLVAASVPAELEEDLQQHARERLNIARHLDAGEE